MTGVMLTPQFVVLHTSHYKTFEWFSSILSPVLEAVASEIDVRLVERVGIRYVDLVRMEPGESFGQYLKPGLVGFPFGELQTAGVTKAFALSHSVAQLADSLLTVRSTQLNTGQFLPPDLTPSPLHYEVQLRPDEPVALLDFDHYAAGDMEFEPKTLVDRLDSLHKVASEAFRLAVQPYAVEQRWK